MQLCYTGSEIGSGLQIVAQASTPTRQPSPTPVFRPASTTHPAQVKTMDFLINA